MKTSGTFDPGFTSLLQERKMNDGWIQTYTGRKVYPLRMTAADIDLRDIAHALALKCRFTGHCERFYSVAQHSVMVSQHVSPGWRAAALLHDAAEAYLPDVASPLKRSLLFVTTVEEPMLFFKEVERTVLNAVCEKFGIEPETNWPAEIKQYDARMLATEKLDLMVHRDDTDWGMVAEHHQPFEHVVIAPWTWVEAKRNFHFAAEELGLK